MGTQRQEPENVPEMSQMRYWDRAEKTWRSCETFSFYGEQATAFAELPLRPVYLMQDFQPERYWKAYPDGICVEGCVRRRVGGTRFGAVLGNVLNLVEVDADDIAAFLVADRVEGGV